MKLKFSNYGELQGLGLVAGFVVFMLTLAGQPSEAPGVTGSASRGAMSPTPESYLRVPPVLPVPTATPESFIGEISWFTCSVEEGTAACIERHTGEAPALDTAASRTLLAGTRLRIEGVEGVFTVRDFCGGCKENGLDLFAPSREEAFIRGRKEALVTIERGQE